MNPFVQIFQIIFDIFVVFRNFGCILSQIDTFLLKLV